MNTLSKVDSSTTDMSLSELQCAVQNLLLRPLPSQSISDDFIAETAAVSRATRLGIYANAYRARFVEALAADYSALKTYLGDDEFETLINAYIERYPSRQFSMRYVGQYLCDFLQTTSPYNQHLDLYELAQFEWALCHAFDAADQAVLGIEDLRAIDADAWPLLRLQFHPSLRRLALLGNAPALWSALNAEQQPPVFQSESIAQHWIVWRQQLRLLFRPLAEHEYLVLDAFSAGVEFADVCQQLSEQVAAEEVPPLVAGFMQQWLNEGLIIKAIWK